MAPKSKFDRSRRKDFRKTFARELRRTPTDAERKLWFYLRAKRFVHFKFRRQQPIGPFIADFYCSAAKLIVELDGGQHTIRPICSMMNADRVGLWGAVIAWSDS